MKDKFNEIETQALLSHINFHSEKLMNIFSKFNNREMSIAKTNLDQAIMWAVKAIFEKEKK